MESGTAAASPGFCVAVLGTIMRRSICVPRIATTIIPRIETTTTASVWSSRSVSAARRPASRVWRDAGREVPARPVRPGPGL